MDDFYKGGGKVLSILILIIISAACGYNIKESALEDTCVSFSKFTINDNIYECKLIENKY